MKSLSPNKLASSSAGASSSIQTSSDFELNSVFSGTIYEHVKAGSGPNNNGEFVTGSSSPSNFHFKLSGTDNNGATITAPTANGSIWISADGTTYSEIQLGSVSSESYGWRVNVADLDQRDIYLSLIAPSGYPIENGDTLYWANSNPAGTPVALADGDVVQFNAADNKFKPAQISSGTTLPSAQDGQALIRENGQWVAGPVIGGVDYATAGDANFSSVSLLLLGNGADGSTTFTDSSSSPFTFTGNGAAEISTTQSKFGGASLSLPSSTASYLSTTSDSSLSLDGDFTIEAWVYNTGGDTYRPIIGSNKTGWGGGAFAVDIYTGGANPVLTLQQHSGAATLTGTTALSLNTWHHVAVTRSGSTVRLFVDGVQDGSVSTTGTYDFGYNGTFYVGKHGWGSDEYHGYIDDLRITKGVARYTFNFTPPTAELESTAAVQITIPYSINKLDDVDTSTVAPTDGQALLWDNTAEKWEPGTISTGTSLPTAQDGQALIRENGQWVAGPVIGGVNYNFGGDADYSSVELLLLGNGTNGSTTITDSSTNGANFGVFGNTQISTLQSKFGGASILFDGSGDYLRLPGSSAPWRAFGTNEFTIESWIYIDANATGNGGIAAVNPTSGGAWNSWGFLVLGDSSNQGTGLQFYVNNNTATTVYLVTYNGTISKSAWHHVAVVRETYALKLYLDGTEVASTTLTAADSVAGSHYFWIGSIATGSYFHGHIDDLRITSGVARYTANFSVPTNEFQTTSGTQVSIPYSIDKLEDVDTSTVAPTDGQALLWAAANNKWEPGAVSATGITTAQATAITLVFS